MPHLRIGRNDGKRVVGWRVFVVVERAAEVGFRHCSIHSLTLSQPFVLFVGPSFIRVYEAVAPAGLQGQELPPGPPFFAGPGHADGDEVVEIEVALVDVVLEDLFDKVVNLLFVGEFPGNAGAGGERPDEDSEVTGDLDVVEGALAQETVGQGAVEGDFAIDAAAVGGQAGQGRAGRGQIAATMRPAGPAASTAPDGAGILPQRMAAGIRFYAVGGGAGFLPQRMAAGIRFYAVGGGAGFLPQRMAAGIRFYAVYGGAGFLPQRMAAGIRFYAVGGGAGILPQLMAAGIRFYAVRGGAGFLPQRMAAGIREGAGLGMQTNRLLSRRPDGVSGGGAVAVCRGGPWT